MSVNESIDPRFLFHVEDESLQFRVGEPVLRSRELEGDRRFRISGIRQGHGGDRLPKDKSRYSGGDDDENDVSVGRRGSLIQPGIDSRNKCDSATVETNRESKIPGSVGWELVVREGEEGKASNDLHDMEYKVMITNPNGDVSNSHNNTQSKRDFASVEKERVVSVSSWESLKAILSDPVTGALMNDATILPCGHSFGAGGLKEVKRMKACFTCSQPTSEGSETKSVSQNCSSCFPPRRRVRLY